MRSMILLGALVVLSASSAWCRAIDDLDNQIQTDNSPAYEMQDWVRLVKTPPAKVLQTLGTTIELECEVMGSPPPKIQWIRGHLPTNALEDYQANIVSETSSSAIVRVRSMLIIDHLVQNERTYTCVGQAGGKTTYASTTIFSAPPHMYKTQNLTELLAMNNNIIPGPQKAKIIYSYSMIFETVGADVLLPCKAIGRPRPEVYWMYGNEIISGQDPRFKVLPSGELLITNLKWADMGHYTCVAQNPITKDSVQTFVYPTENSD